MLVLPVWYGFGEAASHMLFEGHCCHIYVRMYCHSNILPSNLIPPSYCHTRILQARTAIDILENLRPFCGDACAGEVVGCTFQPALDTAGKEKSFHEAAELLRRLPAIHGAMIVTQTVLITPKYEHDANDQAC